MMTPATKSCHLCQQKVPLYKVYNHMIIVEYAMSVLL